MAHTMYSHGQRGAEMSLTMGTCPVRGGSALIKCADPNCKAYINQRAHPCETDQEDEHNPQLCYVGATKSFSGYGPWLCCNHAKVQGWPSYEDAACVHCRSRVAAINKYTSMPKVVKGVPEYNPRPTGGWSHGKGKARKRLLLHSKRLDKQAEANPATSLTKSAATATATQSPQSPRSPSPFGRSHRTSISPVVERTVATTDSQGSTKTRNKSPSRGNFETPFPSNADNNPDVFSPIIVKARQIENEFWKN